MYIFTCLYLYITRKSILCQILIIYIPIHVKFINKIINFTYPAHYILKLNLKSKNLITYIVWLIK